MSSTTFHYRSDAYYYYYCYYYYYYYYYYCGTGNMVADIEGGTQAEGVREQGVESIWA